MLTEARLYAILDLDYVAPPNAECVCRELVAGGAQVVQLRAKKHVPETLVSLARNVQEICREAGVPFIVNDFAELAATVGADGLHVGQDDLSVSEARRISRCRIVGKSTHSLAQARAAMAEKPDYIGFGPLFATPTKPDYIAIGLEDVGEVHEIATAPVFCIGGVKRHNLDAVLDAGAKRVVVVSGLLCASDVAEECRWYRANVTPLL